MSRWPSPNYEIPVKDFEKADESKEKRVFSALPKRNRSRKWILSLRFLFACVIFLSTGLILWAYNASFALEDVSLIQGAYSRVVGIASGESIESKINDLKLSIEKSIRFGKDQEEIMINRVFAQGSKMDQALTALRHTVEKQIGRQLELALKKFDNVDSKLNELTSLYTEAIKKESIVVDGLERIESRLDEMEKKNPLLPETRFSEMGEKIEGSSPRSNLETTDNGVGEIRALRKQMSGVMKLIAQHTGKLASHLAEERANSKGVPSQLSLSTDPFLWKQQTFQHHSFPDFVQFSGYRRAASSFSALGVSLLATRQNRTFSGCWWHPLAGEILTGKPRAIYPGEHHNLTYEAVTLICEFGDRVPAGGYLTGTLNSKELVLFREDDMDADVDAASLLRHNITVCLAPLHGQFPLRRVREFVESYRLQGVSHFLLYNAAAMAASELRGLLQADMDSGLLELIDFHGIEQLESWNHGQLLSIQDCLFRTRYSSQWLLFADMDEYFWPQATNTLGSLLETHRQQGWAGFTHGTFLFSIFKCRGTASNSSSFEVERMPFRWPAPACFDKGMDPELCLRDQGHRKAVLDPRRVDSFCIHEESSEDRGPPLNHLPTSVAAHAHFDFLLGTPLKDFCNETAPTEWWVEDRGLADKLRALRSGYECDFDGRGCVLKA